jgi:anti-anti-sigma factor
MSSLADLVVGVGDDRVVTASISGEVDLSNAADLTRSLVEAVPNEAAGLLLEMSNVVYIDSSGIRMLADLGRRLAWRAQAFVIVAPEASRTRQVLSLTGVAGSFRLEDSTEAGRATMADGSPDEL